MALTHAAATRNSLADLIDTLVNTGAGTAVLRVRAIAVTVADISLANPAFGAASAGIITLAGVPLSAIASATGDLDNFQIINRNGDLIYSGTITATGGGGDLTVNNISVNMGQEVAITSLTYEAAV